MRYVMPNQTNPGLGVRVLRDLVNNPKLTSGAFLALVNGAKHPPALAAVDPDGAEALGFGGRLGGEDVLNLTRLALNLSEYVNGVAQRHAIVRRLPAIEAIGSVSVICTDTAARSIRSRRD